MEFRKYRKAAKTLLGLAAAAVLTLLSANQTYAQETSVIIGGKYVTGAEAKHLLPEDIALPEDAAVVILVGSGRNESSGELRLYRREEAFADSVWTELLSCRAMLGMNGLYKEKEGDGRTPTGTFRMNTPFGIKDPLSGFPEEYIKVDDTYYWNGDPESAEYNRLVRTGADSTDFDRNRSEHITDYSGYYDYCINMGYNEECTPYRGSALFLHCEVDRQETHGCAAVPEMYMTEILRNYIKDRTYMVIYDRETM